MTTEPERLATRLDTSIYYDDMKAASLIRNLILQRDEIVQGYHINNPKRVYWDTLAQKWEDA